MNDSVHTLDVRADFRSGLHPCDKIKSALKDVAPGETLRLLVPFEPVPLFQVAASHGLGHHANQSSEGHWEVLFTHDPEAASRALGSAIEACQCGGASTPERIELDARGLEPPQPMMRILEALTQLPAAGVLAARTDRRPVHLLSQLEFRGLAGVSEEQADGSYITHIRRA